MWNPPYLIPLVEVVQAPRTKIRHVERTLDLLRRVGKTAVKWDRTSKTSAPSQCKRLKIDLNQLFR
ncbi:MAG: 3-hydroxyacyl-CoA dehydrogenase NAD-binding domain-containing protein [Terriglobia bacterium]|jgi:3-hydroxyacyl-CoA dehydrogenase